MANEWRVVIPEDADTSNLVTNPSIEENTTGYTAVGGSIARSTTQQKRGGYSLAVTPTAGTTDGVYYGTVSLTSGQDYTFSVDLFGVNTIPYRIYFATTGAVVKGTPTEVTGNGDWQRVTVTWTADATASFRLYMVKNSHASTGIFYIDGVMCVGLDHDVLYIDGDQSGCKWDGTHHGSTSKRYSTSRAGGQEVSLETYNMYLTELQGTGMPPISHKTLEQALLDGAVFRGSKIPPRSFALIGTYVGTSTANLHSQRKDLLDAIKPDRRGNDQPFLLRYYGANSVKPLEIACQFDTETGNQDYMFYQRVAARLMAYDPFFYEDGNAAKHVTGMTTVTSNFMIARIDGVWDNLGAPSGGNLGIFAIAIDDTYIYFGGSFTNLDGIANADYIARYDKALGTWSALGTGANNIVRGLAIAPNGDLIACGDFTLMGGIANTVNIARWDGSAWNALSTGMSGGANRCQSVVYGTDGTLYAGGDFTTAGGVTARYIAQWSGSAWSALDVGLNGIVYRNSLVIGADGVLYIGGSFTATFGGGTTLNRIAKWDGSSFSALGSGMNNFVSSLAISNSNILYASGQFTTAGGISVNYIAQWNGAAWSGLGTGLGGDYAYGLITSPEGDLVACGNFTSAGGITANRLAIWNGTAWVPIDLRNSSSNPIYELRYDGNDLYIGSNHAGDTYVSTLNTVTNDGTRLSYPRFFVKRSGGTSATIKFLKNEDTGAILWFDYALLDGETLTIDMTPGSRKITSSFFGDVPRAILRGSDFAEFHLLPGDNNISAFIDQVGSPTIVSYLQWRNRHWSLDGVAA